MWVLGRVPARLATGATPGAPGQFTPPAPAFTAPTTKAELDTINPGPTPWSRPGDYVTVAGQQYHWDGSAWDNGPVPVALATGANPGAPGRYTPIGNRPPINKTELDTISLGAAWTTPGNYIDTADGNTWHWDGSAWQSGPVIAPLSTGATSGAPGSFTPTPPASTPPANKAELDTINPGAAWSTGGDWITVAGSDYYWDGSSWTSGRVPTGPQLATDVSEGIPGTWLPAGSLAPQTLPELQSITPVVRCVDRSRFAHHDPDRSSAAWWRQRSGGVLLRRQLLGPRSCPWHPASHDRHLRIPSAGPLATLPAVTTPYPSEIKVYYKQGSPADGISIQWSPFDTSSTVMVRYMWMSTAGAGRIKFGPSTLSDVGRFDVTFSVSAQEHPIAGDVLRIEFVQNDGTIHSIQGTFGPGN